MELKLFGGNVWGFWFCRDSSRGVFKKHREHEAVKKVDVAFTSHLQADGIHAVD